MVDKRFRCDREHDPVAELARLIGQADRHARRAPVESGFREEITSDGDDESTGLPPAPQLPTHLDAREQGCGLDEHEIEGAAYQPCVTDQDYQNEVPSKRLRTQSSIAPVQFKQTIMTFLSVEGTPSRPKGVPTMLRKTMIHSCIRLSPSTVDAGRADRMILRKLVKTMLHG
jgi:hypothetical protein